MPGAFSKFQSAKANGGARNYFKEGEHLVEITAVKFDETRKKIEFFAVEAVVIATDSTDKDMQPGKRVNYMSMSDKDAYFGNVKQFLMACMNATEDELNALTDAEFTEAMQLMAGPEQRFTKRRVVASCRNATSKTTNKEYTAVQWVGVPEEEQAVPL